MGLLVSSVSYRTEKSYVCAVCLLHTDLGQKDLLVATSRCVHVLHGIRHAQFPSTGLEFGHSESHGARSLFVEPCQICQGYARLHGLPYGLAWRRLNRASLTATLSVRRPCCSPSRPSRPKLLAQKSGFSFSRAPTTCSVQRKAFPAFTCVPLSYSSPGSLAVTLVAIGCAVVSFQQLQLQSFTIYLHVC